MPTTIFTRVILIVLFAALIGCENRSELDIDEADTSPNRNSSINKNTDTDSETETDTALVFDSDSDTNAGTDADSDSATGVNPQPGIKNEWDFPMRVPGYAELTGPECEWEPEDQNDWLCTIEYGDLSGVIYVQSDPVACSAANPMPLYEMQAAFIYVDGDLAPLSNVQLEVVEHFDDAFLDFEFQGRHYRYDHSELADWGTACHPMDCLIVSTKDGNIIENGCAPARSLPIVCVNVRKDGTFDPLVDTFEGCAEFY